MLKRMKTRTAVALAVASAAALGAGGIALAQGSGGAGSAPQAKSHSEPADEQAGAPDNSASDTDHAQSGATGNAGQAEREDGGSDQGEG